MGWFLDTFLGYVMMDVIDVEYGRLKKMLGQEGNREDWRSLAPCSLLRLLQVRCPRQSVRLTRLLTLQVSAPSIRCILIDY